MCHVSCFILAFAKSPIVLHSPSLRLLVHSPSLRLFVLALGVLFEDDGRWAVCQHSVLAHIGVLYQIHLRAD